LRTGGVIVISLRTFPKHNLVPSFILSNVFQFPKFRVGRANALDHADAGQESQLDDPISPARFLSNARASLSQVWVRWFLGLESRRRTR
jgi:hypothetical protein